MSFYTKELRLAVHLTAGDQYDEVLENLSRIFEERIASRAQEIEKKKDIPEEVYSLLAEQGYFGIYAEERHGGLGLPYPVYTAALEMLSRSCGSTAISTAIHGTATSGIELYGDDAQREKYLPGLFSGKMIAAFGLTEPGSGSDAGAMSTKAEKKGKRWILNGTKTFITNAGRADLYFIFAKTKKGPTAFLIPRVHAQGSWSSKSVRFRKRT